MDLFYSYLFFCSILLKFVTGISKQNEIFTDNPISAWRKSLKNKSIDARLHYLPTVLNRTEYSKTSDTGLVEIDLNHTSLNLLLCFPSNSEFFKQAYLLAYTVCKPLGFMTIVDINEKEITHLPVDRERYGIKQGSYECDIQEKGIYFCKWNDIRIGFCRSFMEISCGGCGTTEKGSNGIIKTPGFPFVTFPDTICEWDVIVPENHYIMLSFNDSGLSDGNFFSLPCSIQEPYIEIMYGLQSKVTVHRYCRSQEVNNLNIPFNSVKIRAYTGPLPFSIRENKSNKTKGIFATFSAIPTEDDYDSPMKMLLLTIVGLIFISCMIICRYIKKYKRCNVYIDENETLAENEEDTHSGESDHKFVTSNLSKRDNIRKGEALKSPSKCTTERTYSNAAKAESMDLNTEMNMTVNLPEKPDPNRLAVSPVTVYPAVESYYHRNNSAEIEIEEDTEV